MIIVYDSKTGNVERFVNKLDMSVIKIEESMIVTEPFILITYTTGFGNPPKTTMNFLENNYKNLIGVASSGNKNWADNFCKSADIISEKYNIPIVHKFELSGFDSDVKIVQKKIHELR